MKIRPVEAEMFHAERQKDRQDEAKSRFSQLCECINKSVQTRELQILYYLYYNVKHTAG